MNNNTAKDNDASIKAGTLLDYSPMPNAHFENLLHKLAYISAPEIWSFKRGRGLPVLMNFVKFNFMRLAEEDIMRAKQGKEPKIQECFKDSIRHECFNTGLLTPDSKKVYAVFRPHPDRKYTDRMLLDDFVSEDNMSRDYGADTSRNDKAEFFQDNEKLTLDTKREIVPNYFHIINDNRKRWPLPLQSKHKAELREILDDSIKRSRREIEENPQNTALQYYKKNGRENGRLQLLVPLRLRGKDADMALVLERRDEIYSAVTCLARKWAYSNARVIGRPSADWLDPSTM